MRLEKGDFPGVFPFLSTGTFGCQELDFAIYFGLHQVYFRTGTPVWPFLELPAMQLWESRNNGMGNMTLVRIRSLLSTSKTADTSAFLRRQKTRILSITEA